MLSAKWVDLPERAEGEQYRTRKKLHVFLKVNFFRVSLYKGYNSTIIQRGNLTDANSEPFFLTHLTKGNS